MYIVRGSARAIFDADGVTFVLRDGNQCHYADEDAIGPLWKGQRFPMQTCISGWCMLNRQTAVIADIFEDERIPHDVYRRTFVKSLIMAPAGSGTAVAAIGAYWDHQRQHSQRDVDFVEALARAVGEAVLKSRAA
ncbi:MAG: GAF domain-containing protein [Alphaproteobacteria bacterium]|nr:GAF domain-containing protein [Alphaproteobacteria bacterium]MBU6471292.1 GAF domain-containing protein [Alphaproteobacteria bacterium]MDE2011425.1 GAF domain-containing protein [Alphaproteobacteria bacterium]MDE2071816.1 GAF domain-containing protein [Alphaproteobacteria bacterium]MDE2350917.1 GAF domain-containing protein [Alphaproteobacteria bacterium]